MPRSGWRNTLVCLAMTVAGCTSASRKPAPAADSVPAVAPAPPVPSQSNFDVPLDYDFTDMIQKVERAVPLTFGSLDSTHQLGDDERKRYAYAATRGPFTAFARGSQVYLRATLSYTARGYYKPPIGPTLSAGCGTHADRPQIIVELVAPLTLSPSWHLRSRARISSVAPASAGREDHCLVSFLKYDVTERVVDAARDGMNSRLDDIDREVAEVDLTRRATKWWTKLNRPIRLDDHVWLMLQPQRFRLKGVTGTGHVLRVQAGLDAYPMIVTGAEPMPTVSELPPLGKDTASTGFRIALDGNVDYATASRSLSDAMRGKTVTEAGRQLTIQSIIASSDGGGRLALSVAFTGDATGTLRLVGIPRHHAALERIVVPDLDFDLETNSELLKAYAWLRSDAILAMFREKAQFPAAPVLERGKALLMKGLNRHVGDQMTLSATVDSVAVTGLYVTPLGLVIRATGWGTARAYVIPKSQVVKARP